MATKPKSAAETETGTDAASNEADAQVKAAEAAAEAAAKTEADARVKAKEDEPTEEEIVFVAKAMDYDSLLDWKNKPERCDNARAAAKQAILGYRACLRLGELKKDVPVASAEDKAKPEI